VPLEMLGKYERLDVLGHGASGIVYLAKDTLLGKQVALKEISAQGDEKERFLEEARVLDRLRHPNIVQVNSVDEIGGRVVIDMEYVRGRNLQEILRETPQLPLADAVSIAAQICDGLAYAHSQRTVHRDIKPANILLTREGRVKLVDFGLAEVLGTHSFAGGAGTYAYMAPEDFHPEEQSDRQSDIWAVGIILYEMLGGRRPFQVLKAKDPFAWKTAIESDPLPSLSDLRPDVPPELEAIAARALARDKAERYRDAGEMASDLRAIFPTADVFPALKGLAQSLQSPSGAEDFSVSGIGMLSGFPPDLADIDTFLALAPDRWEAAREALVSGTLSHWLRGRDEEPLAAVADEVVADLSRDDDDKLRDFLYRAGLETAEEARHAYDQARRLDALGRNAEADVLLRRAVLLDPSRPEYVRDWTAAQSVVEETSEAGFTLSRATVDFGVLRRGRSRTCKITLTNTGGGTLEGRVSAAPGWVQVEPTAFSTRRRQTLTLTTVTEAVWTAPASYEDRVTLDTTNGRRTIAVSARILPARLSWSKIAFWYVPLLVCAGLPVAAALMARISHPPVHGIQQAGFAAGGLLFLSAFVLTLAAEIAWLPRLLPPVLAGLIFWRLSLISQYASGAKSHLILVQTVTPIVVLLVLQTCAFILDSSGWGNWKIWRWIVAAVGLLASYSLLH
jgi:serine/threonine protein kinase